MLKKKTVGLIVALGLMFATLLYGMVINGYLDFVTMSAPSNPASGNARVYVNSTSNLLSCLTSTGASCSPWTSLNSSSGTLHTANLNELTTVDWTPPLTGWTGDNIGTSTFDTTYGYPNFDIQGVAQGGAYQTRIEYRTAPATPYTACFNMAHDMSGFFPGSTVSSSIVGYAAFFRISSGAQIFFGPLWTGANATYAYLTGLANSTSGTLTGLGTSGGGAYFAANDWATRTPNMLCLRDNGTNMIFYTSIDNGNHLRQFNSQSRTSFLSGGPTQIGFGAMLNGGSGVISLVGYRVCTEPATAVCQ